MKRSALSPSVLQFKFRCAWNFPAHHACLILVCVWLAPGPLCLSQDSQRISISTCWRQRLFPAAPACRYTVKMHLHLVNFFYPATLSTPYYQNQKKKACGQLGARILHKASVSPVQRLQSKLHLIPYNTAKLMISIVGWIVCSVRLCYTPLMILTLQQIPIKSLEYPRRRVISSPWVPGN